VDKKGEQGSDILSVPSSVVCAEEPCHPTSQPAGLPAPNTACTTVKFGIWKKRGCGISFCWSSHHHHRPTRTVVLGEYFVCCAAVLRRPFRTFSDLKDQKKAQDENTAACPCGRKRYITSLVQNVVLAFETADNTAAQQGV